MDATVPGKVTAFHVAPPSSALSDVRAGFIYDVVVLGIHGKLGNGERW